LSRESNYSNIVYIEGVLPFGWKRVKNGAAPGEYLYLNQYSDEISNTRPEENPFFLEESVAVYFHPRERLRLQQIYDEVESLLPLCLLDL
jgi:hypothetical protein